LDGLGGQLRNGALKCHGRDRALAILVDHGESAAGQVAEAVGQVGVIAADERVVTEVAVLAEDYLAQQVITQRVGAHHLTDRLRPDDVTLRLTHLALFEEQPAVREDTLGSSMPAAIRKAGQ